MSIVDKLIANYEELKAKRRVFESEWQEIEYSYGIASQDFLGSKSSPFSTKDKVSSYGQLALNSLVDYLVSGLISSGTKWLNFIPVDKSLSLSYDQREAIEAISNITLKVFNSNKSKWDSVFPKFLTSMVAFGCGNVHVTNNFNYDITFNHIPLSQYYIQENSRGQVDYITRCFKLTARQAIDMFKRENLHKKIIEAYEENPNTEFMFIHCFWKDIEKGEFSEYYIDVANRKEVKYSERDYFPFIIGRWAQFDGEIYGHGQAKLAKAALRGINNIRRQTITSLEFNNMGLMLVADDGVIIPDVLSPGSKIFGGISSLDGTRRMEMLNPAGNPQAGQFLLEMEREVLDKLFYIDKISPPIDKTRRTAYESTLIQQSQMQALTRHIAKILNEGLIPLAELVFEMLRDNGVFDKYLEVLADVELEPEFLSPLARLLKMEDVRAEQQMLQMVLPLLQFNPQLSNKINFEKILEDAQVGTGAPITALRSDEDYVSRNEQQAQMQQQQMQMQNALAASEITKNVGSSDV